MSRAHNLLVKPLDTLACLCCVPELLRFEQLTVGSHARFCHTVLQLKLPTLLVFSYWKMSGFISSRASPTFITSSTFSSSLPSSLTLSLFLPQSFCRPRLSLCLNIHVPSPALVSRSVLCMLNAPSFSSSSSSSVFFFLLHTFFLPTHSHPTEVPPPPIAYIYLVHRWWEVGRVSYLSLQLL